MPSSLGLPPVVACLGTRPSQAARSRARAKLRALPTAATSAVALKVPIPGMVDSRFAVTSLRAAATNSASNATIRRSSSRHCARMSSISRRMRGLNNGGASSRSSTSSRNRSNLRRPWGTVMPRSSSAARSWLISAVRSPTNRERARCRLCMSSCVSLLSSTKRMVGRVAASAIASASRSSFFCALTYGCTYSGDISRTACPCAWSARPRWWAPQQASIAITQTGKRDANLITLSRCMRRRRTTRPDASNPAMLQLFLPRSIPNTAICIGQLPFPLVVLQPTLRNSSIRTSKGTLRPPRSPASRIAAAPIRGRIR
jgi:hypothetical protein